MSERPVTDANQQDSERKIFTLNELSGFNCKNGAPAYIAINGTVYDISNVNLFKDGKHHGVTAGNDVSSLFVHMTSILKRLKIVGKLPSQ